MEDFNFNPFLTIPYEIKNKYLPVRAMTTELGFMGEVAIVGCNPQITKQTNGYSQSSFGIVEDETTEYFLFPRNCPLYDELEKKIFSFEYWIPNKENYRTTKGWILGPDRIIHIDNQFFVRKV